MYGRHRLNRVRPADRVNASFGKAEMLDLALGNQLFDSSGHIFNRNIRVDAMLIEKIDMISVPTVLRKAGLPRDLFKQTRVLVSTTDLFALWRGIENASADSLIGIKLGVETKTERFHSMAIAALSTENLVAASEHIARYKKLTVPAEILVELDEEEFAVGFRWILAVHTEPWILTDYCFSWMRSLAGTAAETTLNPLRVEYVQQPPNIRQIERILGCMSSSARRATSSSSAFPTLQGSL